MSDPPHLTVHLQMERLRANISEADLLQMINDVRKANRAIQEIHDPRFICTYEQAER